MMLSRRPERFLFVRGLWGISSTMDMFLIVALGPVL